MNVECFHGSDLDIGVGFRSLVPDRASSMDCKVTGISSSYRPLGQFYVPSKATTVDIIHKPVIQRKHSGKLYCGLKSEESNFYLFKFPCNTKARLL